MPSPAGLAFATGVAASAFLVAALRLVAPHVGVEGREVVATIVAIACSSALGSFAFAGLVRRAGDDRRAARVGCGAALVAALGAVVAPNIAAIAMSVLGRIGGGIESTPSLAAILALAVGSVPVAALATVLSGLVAGGSMRSVFTTLAAGAAGGAGGVSLAAFVTIERFGAAATCRIAGAFAVAVALGSYLRSRAEAPALAATQPPRDEFAPSRPAWSSFAAGVLGATVVSFGSRAILQVVPGSTRSLAVVVAVFALAIAAGSLAALSPALRRNTPWLVALSGLALALAQAVPSPLARGFDFAGAGALGEALVSSMGLAPGAALAGLLLSSAMAATDARDRARLLAVRSGGAAVALLLFLSLVPVYGSAVSLAAGGVVVAVALLAAGPRVAAPIGAASTALLAALPLLISGRSLPQNLSPERIVAYREGVAHTVVVGATDAAPTTPLLVVDRTRSYSQLAGSPRAALRRGALPAILHERPNRVLVLGVGDGSIVDGLLRCGASSVEVVEASSDVLAALGHFAGGVGDLRRHPNVQLRNVDPVAFVARARVKYDVIVTAFEHPGVPGASRAVAVEHYEALRGLLAEGGLFCQWIPLHRLRFEDFGAIGETFRSVFDETRVFVLDGEVALPNVALVGSVDPLRFEPRAFDARLAANPGANALGFTALTDLCELYLGDGHTLAARFAGESGRVDLGARITFDRPWLEFVAARIREPELVLALNNFNNLALQLGDSMLPAIEMPSAWSPDEKQQYELALGRRAAAFRQFLLAHYWELRGQWVADDTIGDEQREAEQYAKILRIDPHHAATLRAIDRLLRKRLATQRYQQVVELGTLAAQANPEESAIGRNVGLALLLLGETGASLQWLAALDAKGGADAFGLTALAVAYYLEQRDGEARAIAQRALAAGTAENNNLARAIAQATAGEREAAQATLQRVVDHPQWGALARRIAARL